MKTQMTTKIEGIKEMSSWTSSLRLAVQKIILAKLSQLYRSACPSLYLLNPLDTSQVTNSVGFTTNVPEYIILNCLHC